MIKQILLCDKCRAECQFDTIYLDVDRKCDAAGSMDTEQEGIDLCCSCTRSELQKLLKSLDYVNAKEWIRQAKTPMKPARV